MDSLTPMYSVSTMLLFSFSVTSPVSHTHASPPSPSAISHVTVPKCFEGPAKDDRKDNQPNKNQGKRFTTTNCQSQSIHWTWLQPQPYSSPSSILSKQCSLAVMWWVEGEGGWVLTSLINLSRAAWTSLMLILLRYGICMMPLSQHVYLLTTCVLTFFSVL